MGLIYVIFLFTVFGLTTKAEYDKPVNQSIRNFDNRPKKEVEEEKERYHEEFLNCLSDDAKRRYKNGRR